jgi:uncharacterized protein (TIGR03790 family)
MNPINNECAIGDRIYLFVSSALLHFCLSCLMLSGMGAVSFAAELPPNERVLVVYNPAVRASKRIGQDYIRKRNIPQRNICSIKPGKGPATDVTSSVSFADFKKLVTDPICACLNAVGREKILYIVLTYGMPYVVSDVPSGQGKALDQRLVDIWQALSDGRPVPNPYCAKVRAKMGIYPSFVPLATYREGKDAKTIYSVWRLDGAAPGIAGGLVDKALAAEQTGLKGQACVDRRYGPNLHDMDDNSYYTGDWALYRAAQFLRDAGVAVLEDSNDAEFGTSPAPLRCDHAIFYAGWYSLNHYNDVFSWEPGAIGIHLDSESAFNPRGGRNWSANALMRGLTVTSGAVDEPFLQGLPRVDGIAHDLLAGATVGDAFLRNTEVLNWMIINIGDPLYRPPLRRNQFKPAHQP